jgi:hypothetical protein
LYNAAVWPLVRGHGGKVFLCDYICVMKPSAWILSVHIMLVMVAIEKNGVLGWKVCFGPDDHVGVHALVHGLQGHQVHPLLLHTHNDRVFPLLVL